MPDPRPEAATAEAFGCRGVICIKDRDGLCDRDPALHPDAGLLPKITARALIDRHLRDLPIEPVVPEMLANARLVTEVQLINGLTAGAVTRAVGGEPVGTIITAC